jgi:DNA-binding NarL/FixJ family response regulator
MIKSYSQKSRIVIVDGDKTFLDVSSVVVERSGSMVVVGTYESFEDAQKKLKSDDPDTIVIGLVDTDGQSMNALAKFKIESGASLVVYSAIESEYAVFKALEIGISGYLLKDSTSYLELVEGLSRVSGGGVAFSESVARMIVDSFYKNTNSPLSKRETQVLSLISKGNTYAEIAETLFISKETAKTHIRNIYKTLNVTSKSEALEVATNLRII